MKKLLFVFCLAFLATPAMAQIFANGDSVGLQSSNDGDVSLVAPGAGNGNLSVGGYLRVPNSNPAYGTAATSLASSGTVDTTKGWQRVVTAGAVTGVILESGVAHGQLLLLTNDKDSAGSITMAAAATSHVGSGTACVIVAGAGRWFVWDATDAIWIEVGET